MRNNSYGAVRIKFLCIIRGSISELLSRPILLINVEYMADLDVWSNLIVQVNRAGCIDNVITM